MSPSSARAIRCTLTVTEVRAIIEALEVRLMDIETLMPDHHSTLTDVAAYLKTRLAGQVGTL